MKSKQNVQMSQKEREQIRKQKTRKEKLTKNQRGCSSSFSPSSRKKKLFLKINNGQKRDSKPKITAEEIPGFAVQQRKFNGSISPLELVRALQRFTVCVWAGQTVEGWIEREGEDKEAQHSRLSKNLKEEVELPCCHWVLTFPRSLEG